MSPIFLKFCSENHHQIEPDIVYIRDMDPCVYSFDGVAIRKCVKILCEYCPCKVKEIHGTRVLKFSFFVIFHNNQQLQSVHSLKSDPLLPVLYIL